MPIVNPFLSDPPTESPFMYGSAPQASVSVTAKRTALDEIPPSQCVGSSEQQTLETRTNSNIPALNTGYVPLLFFIVVLILIRIDPPDVSLSGNARRHLFVTGRGIQPFSGLIG